MDICVELRYRPVATSNKSVLVYRMEDPRILSQVCSEALAVTSQIISTAKKDKSDVAKVASIEANRVRRLIETLMAPQAGRKRTRASK